MYISLLFTSRPHGFSSYHAFTKAVLVLFFLFSFTSSVNAQSVPPSKQWDKTFGGISIDWLSSMAPTPDGGYLLGGYSESEIGVDKTAPNKGGSDFWVVKTDKDGKKQWDKTFGGNSGDALYSMIATVDGGSLLGGSSGSGIGGDKSEPNRGTDNSADYWIVKIDKNGNKLWDKTYGGNGPDLLSAVVATEDGGYL